MVLRHVRKTIGQQNNIEGIHRREICKAVFQIDDVCALAYRFSQFAHNPINSDDRASLLYEFVGNEAVRAPNVEHALVGANNTGHLLMTAVAALLESVTLSSVS